LVEVIGVNLFTMIRKFFMVLKLLTLNFLVRQICSEAQRFVPLGWHTPQEFFAGYIT